jgi:hypothetical protein
MPGTPKAAQIADEDLASPKVARRPAAGSVERDPNDPIGAAMLGET